jgi:hypothetical protein
METPQPQTALEIAAAIAAFAKSLSDDHQLIDSAMQIARDSMDADYWAARRSPASRS